jgi:hypothetical protein
MTKEGHELIRELHAENQALRRQVVAIQDRLAVALLALDLRDGSDDGAIIRAELASVRGRVDQNFCGGIGQLRSLIDSVIDAPKRMQAIQARLRSLHAD